MVFAKFRPEFESGDMRKRERGEAGEAREPVPAPWRMGLAGGAGAKAGKRSVRGEATQPRPRLAGGAQLGLAKRPSLGGPTKDLVHAHGALADGRARRARPSTEERLRPRVE